MLLLRRILRRTLLLEDHYPYNWAMYLKMIEEAEGDLDSLVGRTVKTQDEIRLVPDILQNGDDFFFPVLFGPR